jgi:2-hydroxyacyl-CoA lyase 1
MILIGGANHTSQNSTGAFQEAPQIESVRMYCKYAARVESTIRIPFYIEKAVRASIYGRPGPVYLDIPEEVIVGSVTEEQLRQVTVKSCPTPPLSFADPSLVQKAIQAIQTAKNPLIIIGKGVAYARAENQMKQFVESTGIPFLPTPMGKGVVSDDHSLCVGAARTDALLNADLIVLVGARLNWMLHFGLPPRYRPDIRFIQILKQEKLETM